MPVSLNPFTMKEKLKKRGDEMVGRNDHVHAGAGKSTKNAVARKKRWICKGSLMPNLGHAETGDWLFDIVMQSMRDGKPMLQPEKVIITIPKFEHPLIECRLGFPFFICSQSRNIAVVEL